MVGSNFEGFCKKKTKEIASQLDNYLLWFYKQAYLNQNSIKCDDIISSSSNKPIIIKSNLNSNHSYTIVLKHNTDS